MGSWPRPLSVWSWHIFLLSAWGFLETLVSPPHDPMKCSEVNLSVSMPSSECGCEWPLRPRHSPSHHNLGTYCNYLVFIHLS